MWKENCQKYNGLVWIAESDGSLKDILMNEMRISVRLLVELKKGDYIRVNGERKNVKEQVFIDDEISVILPNETSEYEKQEMPLNIYYEDEDVLVVEKPYNMVVHPTRNHLLGTMLNGLLYYFDKCKIKSKVRFVNRLDRYTSGILIVAKNAYAHSVITKENSMWDLEKEYFAIVSGKLECGGTIDAPIVKSSDGIKREVGDEGQRAITHYDVICQNEKASFVRVSLETGRTHQIRVHFSHIGHALFGDELYGGDLSLIERQALHSSKLGFFSPRKKEKIEIKIDLPHDIKKLLEELFPETELKNLVF